MKRLTGRMVAINLEPAVIKDGQEESVWNLTTGRQATVENARKAADMGVDMIVLTGNPGVGVDNEAIIQALSIKRSSWRQSDFDSRENACIRNYF